MRNYIPTTPHQPTASSFKPLWRHVGLPAERGIELTHFLRQGLSVSVLDNIQEWSGMSKTELLRISGINERNIARRKNAGQPLNADESERIARLVRVFDAAVRLFNGDKHAASDWLNHPVKGLGHLRPIELIATESGAIEVIDLIGRIEHGVFS
ncbi:type II RES/Xre toxin-antitoxin system antitoxin [Providencia sp. PROV069]|uniref:type II RES/Xre toxin-antitoxin system antitoxin n=1 Tax=Providencia sp. PROV069 TaxID=2949795 RepID=UPI0023494502|nr:antitoxin Xre-like helix-turn-helix domain-containing protein [Providencia sp. PROV069]